MKLENTVENIHYCFTVEDTGMKVYQIVGAEVELPFCDCTGGAAMELVCLRNRAGGPAVIRISGTHLKYSVPENGDFYFVSCKDGFVQTFSTLECSNHEVILRTGTHRCQITEEFTRSSRDCGLYICDGNLALATDGAVLAGGYRFLKSPEGNPVVYVQDGAGIDAWGFPLLPEKDTYRYRTDDRLIVATAEAELCITSERRILCMAEPTLEEIDPAVQITQCDCGYLVLTKFGDVFFSDTGTDWQQIGENAVTLAAWDRWVAYGDIYGNVYAYQYDRNTLGACPVLRFPGKYITELAISEELVAVKFLDNSFDIADRFTGESLMGTRFIEPDLSY